MHTVWEPSLKNVRFWVATFFCATFFFVRVGIPCRFLHFSFVVTVDTCGLCCATHYPIIWSNGNHVICVASLDAKTACDVAKPRVVADACDQLVVSRVFVSGLAFTFH